MSPFGTIRIFVFVSLILTSCRGGVKLSHNDRYLFYLHGGVVTVLGDNAINQSVPEWGPYEYSNILDSLRKRNFVVISEIRKEGVSDSVYAGRIINQIDSLIQLNVTTDRITIVGASAGWNIALLVAGQLRDPGMKYVLMGGCWPNTHEGYSKLDLSGRFLSIIERTDPHGSCYKIFEGRNTITSFNEITLNTGWSHGFIYKGYKEWIDPLVNWVEKEDEAKINGNP